MKFYPNPCRYDESNWWRGAICPWCKKTVQILSFHLIHTDVYSVHDLGTHDICFGISYVCEINISMKVECWYKSWHALTIWGLGTHIYVSNWCIPLTKASDAEFWWFLWNALEQMVQSRYTGDSRSHGAHCDTKVMQTIFCLNAGLLLIGHMETNRREFRIKVQQLSYFKMILNMSSSNCQPCSVPGHNVPRCLSPLIWLMACRPSHVKPLP